MRLYNSLYLALLVFASAIPLIAGALSDEELADCLNEIFDFLGLNSIITEEAAALLNNVNAAIAEDYCNMMAERMEDGSLFPAPSPSSSSFPSAGPSSSNFPSGFSFPSSSSFPSASPSNSSTGYESTVPHDRKLQVTLFTPGYPVVGDVQILYNFGIFDRIPGGQGGLNSRCSTEQEARDLFDYLINLGIDEAAEAACGGDPTGISCAAAAGTGATLTIFAQLVEGCALHDGLVDGAEIEATYENLLLLIAEEQSHFDSLSQQGDTLTTSIATDGSLTRTSIATEGSATRTSIATEGSATRDTVKIESAATQATVTAESAMIQAAVAAGVQEIQNNINTRFEALNERLDTVDETFRIVRRLLLTPFTSRPGYDDSASRCDCTIPTPGVRFGLLSQFCDTSVNCPIPADFP